MTGSTAAVGSLRRSVLAVFTGITFLLVGAGMAAAQQSQSGMPSASVKKWTQGDSESPLMHPGRSCIDCHAKGEGPKFIIAGTVFQKLTEPDDDYGVVGVTVQITDARGVVTKLTTNASGNFFLKARGSSIGTPFTAKVIFKGAENAMGTPQSTGNCASCHAAAGLNGAPGRIIIPQN